MTADNKDNRYYMIQGTQDGKDLYWNGYKWVDEWSQGESYRDIESLLEQFSNELVKKGDKVVRNLGQADEKMIYVLT